MTSLSRLLCLYLFLTGAALVAASGDTLAQTPDAKSKGTGSIAGKVTLGGKAAPGVPVAALGATQNNRRPTAQAITDSEGHYQLFGLAPGQYQVTPLAPSLVPAERNANYPYFGAAKTVLLSAGESVEDLDLKLVRGAVITGRITDAEGKPVIEQRVELLLADEKPGPDGQTSPVSLNYQMFQTDDRGIYRLYGLPAGRYKLGAGTNFSNNARGHFPQTYYPDVNDSAKATVVEVSEGGEAANIDIRLGNRALTFSLAGRVVNSENGEPVPGIRPSYGRISRENPGGAYMGGPPTNARGEFRFEGLEPGHYTIFTSSRFDGGEFYSEPISVDVVDRDLTNIELKAIRGLSISGFVLPEAGTNPNVINQLGPLRVSANVRSASNSPANSSMGMAVVAADGSFRIGGLRAGKASIYVYPAPGPSNRRFSMSRIERDGVDQTQGVDIPAGQSVTDVRVFVTSGTGVIRGTVKLENGSLPADAMMYISLQRDGRRVDAGAATDARGRFMIADLAPGVYEITLNFRFASQSRQSPIRPPAPLKQFVTVTDDAEAEVTFVVDLKPKEGGP
jgi:hypothetical protein